MGYYNKIEARSIGLNLQNPLWWGVSFILLSLSIEFVLSTLMEAEAIMYRSHQRAMFPIYMEGYKNRAFSWLRDMNELLVLLALVHVALVTLSVHKTYGYLISVGNVALLVMLDMFIYNQIVRPLIYDLPLFDNYNRFDIVRDSPMLLVFGLAFGFIITSIVWAIQLLARKVKSI